jgi:hypothetical protein
VDEHAERAPVVLLDLDYTEGVFELVLVNIGTDPVFNLGVSFSRELIGIGGTKAISNLPLWKRLSLLRPGKEIRVFFDSAPNVFRSESQTPFAATVAWHTFDGRRHDATYHHDFDAYRDMPQITGRS